MAFQSLPAQPPAKRDVEVRRGLVITTSTRIVRRVYQLPANPSIDSAVIVIRGDNITVDFNGAELAGTPRTADPDAGAGVAIRVEGGHNVRILNAHVRGYKVGLIAIGTRGLQLIDNDMSFNWKPRLFSVVEHESLVDWMSFHHNEQREWLRFGAGIYLEDVRGGELRGNRVEQGSNGIMLTRSDSLSIHDNTLSYNSALGLALYRSSFNTIARNQIDYNVRGYSHGFFRRGQDSAGLLVYEQSSHNVVAWNSVTHGGDGLFLWAGQSTMDTGEGGANDNLFVGNDFSFAPTNGMEATFSRNDFIGNRIEGSDNGLWGGYSFNSRVIGNCFSRNRVGIAIEHGQDNSIVANHFDGDSTGVSLWANAIEPSDWGYPKHRDTKSRDYKITNNRFAVAKEALKILNTTPLDTSANVVIASERGATNVILSERSAKGVILSERSESKDLHPGTETCDPATLVPPDVWRSLAPRLPASTRTAPRTPAAKLDRSAIIVDEWGPFDWRSPKLWPIDSVRSNPLRLQVVGPPGSWRMLHREGVASISGTSGRIGDTLTVTPERAADDWSVSLEYRGSATRSPAGSSRAAGQPYQFSYGRFEPHTDWDVRFHRWPDTTAKELSRDAFDAARRGPPLVSRHEPRLDFMWYRPTVPGVPQSHFAAEATTEITLTPGVYTLRTISDDAIRVYVDGTLAIDHWTPHESAIDVAPLTAGRHQLRVEYAQVDGWTELRVEVVRGTQRSTGSPGPH
ncbi:MAG: NosD domain-containing protein [bacterium]